MLNMARDACFLIDFLIFSCRDSVAAALRSEERPESKTEDPTQQRRRHRHRLFFQQITGAVKYVFTHIQLIAVAYALPIAVIADMDNHEDAAVRSSPTEGSQAGTTGASLVEGKFCCGAFWALH